LSFTRVVQSVKLSSPEKLADGGDGSGEADGSEPIEQVVDCGRRVCELPCLFLHDRDDSGWGEVDDVEYELVGALGFDFVEVELVGGEVSEVGRDDHLGVAADGGGEDVTIMRVGQRQAVDEGLVIGDEAIGYCFVHELSCSCEPIAKLRLPSCDGLDHLGEDLFAPPGLKETGLCKSDQQVAKGPGIEHTGVVDGNKAPRWRGQYSSPICSASLVSSSAMSRRNASSRLL
jgi:hypothetical protein